MIRLGLHVSGAGGLEHAPENAKAAGCEVFQFFSRSPRGGSAPDVSASTRAAFRAVCQREGFESYIHAPYYINFASAHPRISHGSVAAIREELKRGTILGVRYVMTHLGSRKDLGQTAAVKQVIARLQEIFSAKEKWTTTLLLENSAGAENVVGDTFEELGAIWKGVGRSDVGICLDSCHLFVSGYDIRTSAAITHTMKQFQRRLPLSAFKLVHANDSRCGLGERKDRHADIGDGMLGVRTFSHLLAHPAFRGRNFVLETPGTDARRKKDVALMKKLRDAV